jgi:chloramphenicol-sensitive protein RarD
MDAANRHDSVGKVVFPFQTRFLSMGTIATAAAFLIWGLVPFYWKIFTGVNAVEVIAHRILWSLLLLSAAAALTRNIKSPFFALRDRRTFLNTTGSALLLSANWLTYVWAVTHDRILAASLGYYLVPLVNIGLGYVFLQERLRPLQWTAVAFAAIGIAVFVAELRTLPAIALIIAGTFGTYGLLKKQSPLDSIDGLMGETLILLPLAAVVLGARGVQGNDLLVAGALRDWALLPSTGVMTALPLVLFVWGARRIPLATVGMLQFLAPTCKFVIAVLAYHEPLDKPQLLVFGFIWAGVFIYLFDTYMQRRKDLR